MARTLKMVDAHAHLGGCCVFGITTTEEELIRRMDECEIDATIVQPYPGAKEAVKAHDRIAELCAKYPGRFFGLASLSPHGNHDAYRREVERCVKDLNFVGLKLHTIGHGVNPTERRRRFRVLHWTRSGNSGDGPYGSGRSVCPSSTVHPGGAEVPRP